MGSHSLETLHTRGDASEAPLAGTSIEACSGTKAQPQLCPLQLPTDTPAPGVAQSRLTYDSHKWPGTGDGGAPWANATAARPPAPPRPPRGQLSRGGGAEWRSACPRGPAPATQDTHLHRASKSTAWACAEPAAATSSSSSRSGGRSATRGPEGTGPGRTTRIAWGVGLTAAGRLEPRLGHGRAATAESKLQEELEGERGERAGARGE